MQPLSPETSEKPAGESLAGSPHSSLTEAISKLPRRGMKVRAPEPKTVAPAAAPEAADAPSTPFAWSDGKRRRLMEEYINTGDLLGAMEAVGCKPVDFNLEVSTNSDFAQEMKNAREDAAETLSLRAKSEALDGNDKLLGIFLKAPGDSDEGRKLTNEQLTARLKSLIERMRKREFDRSGVDPCACPQCGYVTNALAMLYE